MAGVTVARARQLLLGLSGVEEGLSYGMPSFKVGGRFFARFRDDDTVLVLQLANLEDRELLLGLHPRAFFFTDHYRNYPAVLIRLAAIPVALLASVVGDAHRHAAARKPARAAKPGRRRPT